MNSLPVFVFGSLTLMVGFAILRTIGSGVPSAPMHLASTGTTVVDRSFPLAGASGVRIVTGTMDVHVEPIAMGEVAGTLRVSGPLPVDVASRLAVTLDRPGGVATLSLRSQAHGWSFGFFNFRPVVVAFDERLPTTIVTGSGDITIDDSQAPLAVDTGSGDLTFNAPQADVSVRSSSGDVRANAVRGALDIRTAKGDVRASLIRGWSGARIAITTLSGDVVLRVAAAHAALRTATTSGDVTNSAGLPQALAGAPTIAITTDNGDITVK